MNLAPRLAASWISICIILCRVRPMTTQIFGRLAVAFAADDDGSAISLLARGKFNGSVRRMQGRP